ncbi:MAG: excinuclease ABC subunit UvrC [Epsilonproteobacteria bacterium]|nr:excinuclease ABC subunit UvrC [Campylobacterota bacterium]
MNLKKTITLLPDKPGIYQYFDAQKRLLYIGKAKNLKKRVSSYFRFKPDFGPAPKLGARIAKMISESVTLEYLIVESEHDALILENSLIKQLKPKYNILLRDDKTYPYIYIDLSEDFPRFEITRRVIKGKHIKYFGPFSTSANEILQSLYDIFPLVQKKGCLTGKKACLFHQIEKCLAPCEGKITPLKYGEIINQAIEVVNDRKKLIKLLKSKMEFYSENLLFEEALKIRDSIVKIEKANILSHVDLAKLEDFDIFAVAIDTIRAVGVRLFIREGKVTSSSYAHFKSDNGFDIAELYKVLLLEYYQHELPYTPQNILVYEDFEEQPLLETILEKKFHKKIPIKRPKIGERKKLTELAYKNGVELLRLESHKNNTSILEEIKSLFSLEKTPFEIEGYDNSHMMGQATVGAMIKWNEKFIKKEYRHYNLEAKDEYAQMRELISRRVESFHKNPPPDLMVIDGGATLLKLAIQIVKQNNVFVDVIAIAKEKRDAKAMRAKGKAYDIIYTTQGEFKLSPNDKRLQFIQNIRDESHRFAITFFKKQKLKSDQKISLLNKKGIGEATVRKLLQYFETFDNIENATFEEIEGVVGTKIAKSIKNI